MALFNRAVMVVPFRRTNRERGREAQRAGVALQQVVVMAASWKCAFARNVGNGCAIVKASGRCKQCGYSCQHSQESWDYHARRGGRETPVHRTFPHQRTGALSLQNPLGPAPESIQSSPESVRLGSSVEFPQIGHLCLFVDDPTELLNCL